MSISYMNDQIREHMEVLSADGRFLGSVERVGDGRIRLAGDDWAARTPLELPLELVASVGDKVHLGRTFDEFRRIERGE